VRITREHVEYFSERFGELYEEAFPGIQERFQDDLEENVKEFVTYESADGLIDLSGPGQARRTDPETSRDAAAMDRTIQRAIVLAEFRHHEICVASEIAGRLGWTRDAVTPRLGELQKPDRWSLYGEPCGPLVVFTGVKRPSPYGGTEQEYRITQAGKVVVSLWPE
jgi:hypothetical protein